MTSSAPAEPIASARPTPLASTLSLARAAFGVPHVALALEGGDVVEVPAGARRLDLVAAVGPQVVLDRPFVSEDCAGDPALAGRRIGAGGPALRFAAASSVRLESGRVAGTLWLLGSEPRRFGPDEALRLAETAGVIAILIADSERARLVGRLTDALSERMRRAHEDSVAIARYRKMYERASALAHIGVWECDLATEELSWTDGVYDIFELPRGGPISRDLVLTLYERESRLRMERMRRKAIEECASCSLDIRIRTAAGNRRWVRLTIDVEAENGRAVRIFGLKQDITQERDLLDRLRRLAEVDPMTGLANRSMFEGRLARSLAATARTAAATALVLIDLDGFKEINDTHGHAAGDECLRQIARRLRTVFRRPHVIGRIGGDEFAVLVQGPRTAADVERLAVEAIAAIRRPIEFSGARLTVGASVGVSLPDDIRGYDLNALFAEADQAMYAAKKSGRDGYRVFGREGESAVVAGGAATPCGAPPA